MGLYRIEDFNPNYREEAFDGDDVKGLSVYADGSNDNIGTIDDVLIDESGRFRYFVIDTGTWGLGKKVLLPMGQSRIDVNARRIYATGLRNKQQAERLPQYNHNTALDYDYEEQVRNVYRMPAVGESAPVEMSSPVEESGVIGYTTTPQSTPRPAPTQPAPTQPAPTQPVSQPAYSYDREPTLYNMNDRDHQKFRLYEERLVASKTRRNAGQVRVGKHVETETARASVPVEKERVVIERRAPQSGQSAVVPGDADFREGNVAKIDIYEETANIGKQTFVREEVKVSKQVEQNTVQAQETLRREDLDVDTDPDAPIRYIKQPPNHR